MSSHNVPRGCTEQGLSYHVSSEVNRKAFELEPDDKKKLFLIVIEEAVKKGFKFKLWNFYIMGNHFHFLITPEKRQSLSEILKWIKSGGTGFSHGRSRTRETFGLCLST
ncbi:MAG: transposase [Spirochaetaceae bacterium]|jgi:REP element-mobilizing transposase RayT|nr:transposase [Spirochaetaceae bacterium]